MVRKMDDSAIMEMRRTLTLSEASEVLGVAPRTLQAYASSGRIPTVSVLGGRPRVEPLVAWAARMGLTPDELRGVARAIAEGRARDDIVADVRALVAERLGGAR